jgi:hypothetical protein
VVRMVCWASRARTSAFISRLVAALLRRAIEFWVWVCSVSFRFCRTGGCTKGGWLLFLFLLLYQSVLGAGVSFNLYKTGS